MSNRYPGKCGACGNKVEAMKGRLAKSGGRWVVYHSSSACLRAERRELTEEGLIYCPYSINNKAICAGLPGARWDRERGAWKVSMDPRHRSRLLKAVERLRLKTPEGFGAAESSGAAERALARAGDTPYPFQREGIKFLCDHQNALLGDDMGLGKTLQAVFAIEGRAIVVCPATLKLNWQAEVRKWRTDLTPTVLSGRGSFRAPTSNEVVILNYEILPADLGGQDLEKTQLIVDEIHYAKSHKALRSKRLRALGERCRGVWGLSGTPLLNKPFDLWGVLTACGVEREVFGSFGGFLRLMRGSKGRFGYDFGTPDPSVPERLRRAMLRRTKGEELDLPQKTYQDMLVEVKSKRLLKLTEKALRALLEEGDDYLPEFSEFSEIRAALSQEKIPAVEELVASYEEAGEPVVVFSAHRGPVEALGARDGWATIMGDTPMAARAQAVADFQNGLLKGIALTIGAGATGITLTRASRMVFVDLDWNPAANAQAEDRICRIGQEASSLQYVRFVSDCALDKHVLRLLDQKKELISAAIEKEVEADDGVVIETRDQRDQRFARARIKCGGWGEPGEPVSEELRAEVVSAVGFMLGQCDGAQAKDGVGFNKPDASRMHTLKLAALWEEDALVRFAHQTLRKYRGQLGADFNLLFGGEK